MVILFFVNVFPLRKMHLTNLKVKADKKLTKVKSADFPKYKIVRGKAARKLLLSVSISVCI